MSAQPKASQKDKLLTKAGDSTLASTIRDNYDFLVTMSKRADLVAMQTLLLEWAVLFRQDMKTDSQALRLARFVKTVEEADSPRRLIGYCTNFMLAQNGMGVNRRF